MTGMKMRFNALFMETRAREVNVGFFVLTCGLMIFLSVICEVSDVDSYKYINIILWPVRNSNSCVSETDILIQLTK